MMRGVGEQLTAVGHDLGHDLGEFAGLEQGLALLHDLAVGIADQARHQLGDGDDRVLLAHLHEHTSRCTHISLHARSICAAQCIYARLTLDATPARLEKGREGRAPTFKTLFFRRLAKNPT
jgi:hypothetical protein